MRGVMTAVNHYPSTLSVVTTTIASGQTVSDAINLSGTTVVGISFPAALTSTSISFQSATAEGGLYQPVMDESGANVSYIAEQGKYLTIHPAVLTGVRFLKIVAGTVEASSRSLDLVAKPL